jgi:hypothetical protein
MKFTAILLVMMSRGRFSGTCVDAVSYGAWNPPPDGPREGPLFLLVALSTKGAAAMVKTMDPCLRGFFLCLDG